MKNKTPTRKKTATRKAPARKKTAARKAPAQKKTAARKAPAQKKTAARKAPAQKTQSKKSDNTLKTLKSVLKRMIEIRDNMEELNAEMRDLYTYAAQLAAGIEDMTAEKTPASHPLFQSKLWKFLKKEKPTIFIPSKIAKEKKWTNQDGKTILATLVSVTDDEAVLKTKEGVEYRYPIEALSNKNQAEIATLTP